MAGMTIAATEDGRIAISRKGPVALLRLVEAGPGRRLRLTPPLLDELGAAIRLVSDAEDVALIMISGGAREFCLGADLDRLRSSTPEGAERYLRLGQDVIATLADAPVPTIAAVNGLALGGGFELAMGCDLRWAQTRAVFGLPECSHGLVPAWGAVAALAGQLPHAVAWELLLGQRVSARRACDLGLVGRVFECPDFIEQAMAAATELAAAGRGALMGIKRLWRGAAGRSGHDLVERHICLERLAAMRGGA